jgi:alkanesulfonate monooxygenase SsuD/methylene tetrahydromethanopterin reductase-like flavin-dependent oxidoreductase (luciferase family)
MKFSVLQFFSWPKRHVPLDQVYDRALERVRIMDASGYDAVWLAEHHFSSYSVCPSVHIMGMHIAGMTDNLRIGTGVSLAAFYHPLRLAEEVALLDVLSGGRVNWGAGRGFDRKELECFDVAPEDSYPRFRENIDVVLAAWREDRLNFRGQFYEFADVEVLPKPAQSPHPPVWIASSSDEAIQWSAEHGFAILMDPHSSHSAIARKYRDYRATLSAHGHELRQDIPMARLLSIAPTEREAEAVARSGAEWMFKSYVNPRTVSGGTDLGSHQAELARQKDPLTHYLDEVVIHGTPEKVTDELRRLQEELPLQYLLAAPLSHKSFQLLTDEVMPHLA